MALPISVCNNIKVSIGLYLAACRLHPVARALNPVFPSARWETGGQCVAVKISRPPKASCLRKTLHRMATSHCEVVDQLFLVLEAPVHNFE